MDTVAILERWSHFLKDRACRHHRELYEKMMGQLLRRYPFNRLPYCTRNDIKSVFYQDESQSDPASQVVATFLNLLENFLKLHGRNPPS